MIQEKPTSLRILQRNKKKALAPIIYLLIGFILGILFSLFAFFLFFKTQASPDLNSITTNPQEEPPVLPVTKQNAVVHTVETSHQESTEAVEDNNFAQPQSSELNKFFQHAPVPVPHSQQRVSPFANEPNAKPAQPVAAKTINIKNEAAPANKAVKPATPSKQAVTPKEAEPEADTPDAVVQIKITQKAFAVNELK